MYLHDGADYPTRASMLVRRLVDHHDPKYGVGSMTVSIYDTAWVSIVARMNPDGQLQWLFPSSFQYLLDHQQHDGGWQSDACDLTGILNGLAALLALCRHISQPLQMKGETKDLSHRKSRAIYSLETKFTSWDTSTLPRSGTQPLIAKLLQMLDKEGVHFRFPNKDVLFNRKRNDVSDHELAALYSDARTMATCSLEGQVGDIEFDRVRQHRVFGSMMASPASTAAYLMTCSSWDDEAEAYLSHIVSVGDGISTGGVPTKFPTTIFELTNVITLLLENGFTRDQLDVRSLDNAAGFLEECLQLELGVTGFAPYVVPDADNTSKTISALHLLERYPSLHGLFTRFETREFFKTYAHDRDSSFTTNCHVLKAMLDTIPVQAGRHTIQIEKVAQFLCNRWWTNNGRLKDQSNVSENYPTMLMSDVFTKLIERWENGDFLESAVIRNKIFISLFQALIITLRTQNADGSWGSGGCETTAYGVITLIKVRLLSSAPKIKLQIAQAIESGRRFLCNNFRAFSEPEHVWSGKATSGSHVLYQAYVLAALHAPVSEQQTASTIESHVGVSLAKVTIQTKYYARQASFVNTPEWLIQACLIESSLFLPQLKDVRYAIFPSNGLASDRYFESIPFAWVAANTLQSRSVGAEFLYQMMVLSILNRQFENYMKNVIGKTFAGCLFEVEDLICGIIQELEYEAKDQCFCNDHEPATLGSSSPSIISEVRSIFYRFISHILNHPYVLMASLQDQAQLKSEFLSFLLSRVSRLSSKDPEINLANDQTSHSYMFAFLACLVGNQSLNEGIGLRRDFFDTPEQQYLAVDLCRHISIISFMSDNSEEQNGTTNDAYQPIQAKSEWRSITADQTRGSFSRSVSSASTSSSTYNNSDSPISPVSSVSSVDSPVFTSSPKRMVPHMIQSSAHHNQESLQMTRLVHHERRCIKLCLESLREAGINQRTSNILGLFVDVTELSEQIFRDPNVGGTLQSPTADPNTDLSGTRNSPPVPPKRSGGSVAAARAGLSVEPLAIKQDDEHPLQTESLRGIDPPQRPQCQNHRVGGPAPDERDWSWNRKPAITTRRASRASSEVSRIESIMSEIDGISLDFNPKPKTIDQRRTGSESDAAWTQPHNKIDARRRLTDHVPADAESIKLAKVRLQTYRHLSHEAKRKAARDSHQRTIVAEAAAQRRLVDDLQARAAVDRDAAQREVQRKATFPAKASQGVREENVSTQASKLRRASRLGGPKWKAPF